MESGAAAAEFCARLTVHMAENDPVWGAFVVQAGLYIAKVEWAEGEIEEGSAVR